MQKKYFIAVCILLICISAGGCKTKTPEEIPAGSTKSEISDAEPGTSGTEPEDFSTLPAAEDNDFTEYTFQGVTFSLNSRCEEKEPQGIPPYLFTDKQTDAQYMVVVNPGADEKIMEDFTQIIEGIQFQANFEEYQFFVTPEDYAELVTDAGDVYNYNIMTTRYKKGDGIHVANVCSGNVIVSVYADFRKEDEAERSLEEIERILRSLKIDETEALESFPSDAGEEGMQVVGNETVGYVSVPDTWVKFTDLDGGTDFQYSNIEGTAIITMNIFDTKGLSDEQKAALDTRSAASSVWYNLENNDVTDISGATVKIGTYDALQVYGSFTSEDHGLASYIVCWIFEDENGIMHYVSAEAPVESASEVVSYVESSFTLTLKE